MGTGIELRRCAGRQLLSANLAVNERSRADDARQQRVGLVAHSLWTISNDLTVVEGVGQ